jgi:large subunit ribosomal protein L31
MKLAGALEEGGKKHAISRLPSWWLLLCSPARFMKKDIHPEKYRPVVFHDTSNGDEFLIQSCAPTKDTTTYEGEKYPVYPLGVSSSSHPFYTGTQKFVDTAGRVDKFQQRAAKAKALQEARADAKDKKKKQV